MKLALLNSSGGLWLEIDYPTTQALQSALTAAIPTLAAHGILEVIGNNLDWQINGSTVQTQTE